MSTLNISQRHVNCKLENCLLTANSPSITWKFSSHFSCFELWLCSPARLYWGLRASYRCLMSLHLPPVVGSCPHMYSPVSPRDHWPLYMCTVNTSSVHCTAGGYWTRDRKRSFSQNLSLAVSCNLPAPRQLHRHWHCVDTCDCDHSQQHTRRMRI